MSAPTVSAAAPRRHPGAARALLVLLVVTAAVSTAVLLGAAAGGPGFSDGDDARLLTVFLFSLLLPFFSMGALVVMASRTLGGVPVVVFGTVVLVAVTLAVVLGFWSSRSLGALGALFSLSDHQWSITWSTAVLVVGVHVLLRLRAARRPPGGEGL